jgi:hypothetical protein
MLVNRRAFLAAGTAATAAVFIDSPIDAQKLAGQAKPGAPPAPVPPKGRRTIYRLSLRGRRGSNFAKRYNANMRFATAEVAASHHAHPGDRSRVVPLTISAQEYARLFTSRRSLIADLRRLGPPRHHHHGKPPGKR